MRNNCRAIQCNSCHFWHHLKYTNQTIKLYNYLSSTDDLWLCCCCRNNILPFSSIINLELIELCFNLNRSCLCSDFIAEPRLEYLSRLDIVTTYCYQYHSKLI